jgi:hypothetical protein
MAETVFLRLLAHDDKAAALAGATGAVREGRASNPTTFAVDPASFSQVPGSPFAYWVNHAVRSLFKTCDCLEDRGFKTMPRSHNSRRHTLFAT